MPNKKKSSKTTKKQTVKKKPSKLSAANNAELGISVATATLKPLIGVHELLALHERGHITENQMLEYLGFPKKQEPTVKTENPIALRKLKDGTLENLFADGKRLLVPKEKMSVKSFGDLPAPWRDRDFSDAYNQEDEPSEEEQDDDDELSLSE